MSNTLWVKVLDVERYTDKIEFECSLDRMIEQLQEVRDGVPEEYRSLIQIDITSTDDYDSHTPRIQIAYTRPKTNSEIAADEEQKRIRSDYALHKERLEYERLKRQFEG